MQKVIHYNPRLQHQVDHAQAFLASGFTATPHVQVDADVHVVSGPWYALDQWKHHPRTLKIDRAWWGDPDNISIGWLNPDGTRRFASGSAPRPKPRYEPWGTRECSCLILADYGQDVGSIEYEASKRFITIEVRQHPADTKEKQVDLKSNIRLRDVIICSKGTAGFEAIMMGKPVICLSEQNELMPVCAGSMDAELYRGDRDQWLHDMSYKQFSLSEIADGTAWELLRDV